MFYLAKKKEILVQKRDDRLVRFSAEKIFNAIKLAFSVVKDDVADKYIADITNKIVRIINKEKLQKISVEHIQDIVENVLIKQKELDVI